MKIRNSKLRTWGFQFSKQDAIALIAFGAISYYFYRLQSDLWWLLIIAAGHFFLFCNVFRIVRKFELIWAGVFILNVAVWLWNEKFTCSRVLLTQVPTTIVLIGIGMRSPIYHGIFANRLNLRLDDYLKGKV